MELTTAHQGWHGLGERHLQIQGVTKMNLGTAMHVAPTHSFRNLLAYSIICVSAVLVSVVREDYRRWHG